MKPFVSKLLWLLGVPLVLGLAMLAGGEEGIMSAGLMLMFLMPAYLVIGCLLAIFSREYAETGKALVLASGVMLVVGLSTCGIILASM
ncbi:hypothetical protein SAMN04488128_1021735 [Chitinophaga eiseniae]|uniref:Uncharacterized protein n=1 Tax=Chitinophaga eiseniae TaxID=634771 RepID=A0A1T4S386_9BACT|nr:hypothetical protein [Chitinophaga eiseniae]SKA22684.1 hypothetical protein SAMN04488128_1021735 [Chitinophaga eiseniae]